MTSITCPHCGYSHDRDKMYPMMLRFSIYYNGATLQCFSCKKEFDYGYHEYYDLLLQEKEQ